MEETKTKICKCCGRELPTEMFVRNAFGVTSVCKECNSQNRSESAQRRKRQQQQAVDALNARQLRLEDFTPRELMAELKRRGYEGKIRYVEVHEINLNDI